MRAWLPLALCCALLPARAATDAPDQQMLQGIQIDLARIFALAPEFPLDPALRSAADDISAAHLQRMRQLVPQWTAEEKKLQTADGQTHPAWQLYSAVWARVLNELALWQIEPGDAAYEDATLDALKTSPLACRTYGDFRFRDYAARIARLQAMPAARRTAALESERRLLARWGQARPAAATLPDPLPHEAALAALASLTPDQQAARLALPPILAAEQAEKKPYAKWHPEEQCLLQQWWLRESLRRGATPAAVLNAFRYGTLVSVSERYTGMFDQPAPGTKPQLDDSKPVFPRLAARFAITGSTILSAQLDDKGKPRRVSVVQRTVSVPGIRGERAIAFENVFDQAAVDYGMKGFPFNKTATDVPIKFQLMWTLPPEGAAP